MATYYVATNGSNSNDGSIGSPKASAPSGLNPGDTVIYRAGNYFQRIEADASGSSGSPITYKAYTGETVRMYGVSNTNYILYDGGQDWIVFDGFYVEFYKNHTDPLSGSQYRNQWVKLAGDHCIAQNLTVNKTTVSTEADAHADYKSGYREEGINVSGDYVTVDTCTIRGTNKGIRVASGNRVRDLQIIDCNIYETVQSCIHAGAGTGAESGALIQGCRLALSFIEDGIQFFNDPDNISALRNVGWKIKDCIFYGNAENAIDFKAAYYVTIEDCTIVGTIGSNNGGLVTDPTNECKAGWNRCAYSTFGQGAGTRSENVILRNCVLFDNCEGAGMKDRPNFKIYNCTIVYNRRDYTGGYTTYDGMAPPQNVAVTCPSAAADGLAIINCIIGGHAPDGQVALYRGAQTYINYNCYYTGTNGVARNIWRTGSGGSWESYAWAAWKTKLAQLTEISGGDVDSQWLDDHADVEFINVPDKPRFENYAEYDWRVAATSPAYEAGGALTRAANSGNSSTSLKVEDPFFFCDGYGSGVYGGDTIYLGGSPYVISSIDYDTKIITLASSATWSVGASIYWGSATPNIGLTDDVGGGTYVVADFSGTPLSGSAPLSVSFTDASSASNTITAYSYERNDGSGTWEEFSTSASPASVSFAEGVWSVRLTITTVDGTNTKTRTNYIVSSAGDGSTTTPTTNNQIVNGDFATGDLTNWKFYTAGTGSAVVSGGACIVNVSATGGNTQLFYRPEGDNPDIGVVEGRTYVLRFRAKAGTSSTSELSADVLMDSSPYTNLGLSEAFTADTSYETHEFVFTATASSTDARVRVRWTGATVTQDIYLDDFEFYELVELTVSFTASDTSGTSPLVVTFTDTSTGASAISDRSWTIAGNEVSTASSFSYTFGPGSHTVTLTVTDADGNTGSTAQAITVTQAASGSGGKNSVATRVLSNASGDSSTQTIALSGLSNTPNFVMIVASVAASDGTAADNAYMSVGFYDGSTQIVHMAGSKSATAQTYSKCISKSGKSVLLVGPEDNVTLAEAAISSLSATGIELTWSTLPSTAVYLTVTTAIFDSVTVRSVTQPAENSTTTVNDLGYDPDLLLVFSSFTTLGNAIAQPMRFSFGFHTASSDMAASYHERAFATDSEPTNRLGTDYALYRTQQGALDLYQGDLALVTGGFTYQSLDEAGAGDVTVVAIDTGSTGTSVQVVDTPTSTGAANLFGSALAFQPGMVLAFSTWRSAVDADGAAGVTNGDAGAWAITQAIDGAEYSTAWAIEDAQATTDTQSLSDNQWLNMPDDSGANAITVTGATWGSDNVSLTWGAVDGTARKMLVLAVELIEVDPSGTDYFQTSMRAGLTVGMP